MRGNFTTVCYRICAHVAARTAERRRSSMPKQQKGPAAVGSHGEDFVEAIGRARRGISAAFSCWRCSVRKDLVGALDST